MVAGGGKNINDSRRLTNASGKFRAISCYSNLGDTPGAMEIYRRSLEIRQRLNVADPNNRKIIGELTADTPTNYE